MPGLIEDYVKATDEIQRVAEHCETETIQPSSANELQETYRHVRAMYPDATPREALQEAKHQITSWMLNKYATYEALWDEQKHHDPASLVRDIDRYLAATPEHCAEHHLAQQLRDQIAAENLQINLTQRYATHDLAQAQQRHSEAVKNLTPLIENAREFGFTVHAGNAIAAEPAHKEMISESYGMRV